MISFRIPTMEIDIAAKNLRNLRHKSFNKNVALFFFPLKS